MITEHSPNAHSVGAEVLAAYVAGTLPASQQLVLSCQADVQPAIAQSIADYDAIGGAVIETAKGEPVSDNFLERLMSAIDEDSEDATEAEVSGDAPGWMPSALSAFLKQAGIELNWRTVGPGVEQAPLVKDWSGERLYLLRAAPGTKMPVHSHTGEEWTLVLQGGYHVGEVGYVRGDLHWEDETCQHQPIIDDDGEACISLVADQGLLKFRNPLLTLLQTVTRI